MLGNYTFSRDAIAEIRRNGSRLEIELTVHANSSSCWFVGHPAPLTAVATDKFEMGRERTAYTSIATRTAQPIGITINPGAVAATSNAPRTFPGCFGSPRLQILQRYEKMGFSLPPPVRPLPQSLPSLFRSPEWWQR